MNGLMAAQGRNGDTSIAHMTLGEIVIPAEVAQMRPDLVQHVAEGLKQMGLTPEKYVVGNGRINPNTGIEEFATEAEVRAAYQSVLGREPEAAGLANWMAAPDLSTFRQSAQPELDARNRANSTPAPATPTPPVAAQVNQSALMSTPQIAPAPAVEATPVVGGTIGQIPQSVASTAQATKATSTGYDPTLTQVNAPTDTVQGQIKKIIEDNSPLEQMAETRSNQQMNRRGLMNSSMAVQAGQAALYDVALPIATADANTYNATRFNNQNASNTAAQFGAASQNQAELANAQLGTSTAVANASNATDVSKFNQQAALAAATAQAQIDTDVSKANSENGIKVGSINQDQTNRFNLATLQQNADIAKFNASQSNDLIKLGMDSATRTQLANIEANYRTLMQSSASASDLYKQSITNAATILSNPNMTPEAKATALNNLNAQLNEGLGIIGDIANLDIGGYLNFAPAATVPVPAANTAAQGIMNPVTPAWNYGDGGGDGGGE